MVLFPAGGSPSLNLSFVSQMLNFRFTEAANSSFSSLFSPSFPSFPSLPPFPFFSFLVSFFPPIPFLLFFRGISSRNQDRRDNVTYAQSSGTKECWEQRRSKQQNERLLGAAMSRKFKVVERGSNKISYVTYAQCSRTKGAALTKFTRIIQSR